MSTVDETATAIRAGKLAIVPTDTVYGLAARADSEDAARALYRLKGRKAILPTALVFASVDVVRDRIGELPASVSLLLPGPFTLVVPNPKRRYPWLTGARPEAIGVRVPNAEGVVRELLDAVGAIVATSANLPGEPSPTSLDEVPAGLREGVAATLDGGRLPGRASTVIDLTGAEPFVLREGAVTAAEALRRLTGS